MKLIKLIAALLLILVQLLCIASCRTNDRQSSESNVFGATSSQVRKFTAHILDNEYADAIALYNSEISGNSELEAEAATFLEDYLSEIKSGVFSGEYADADAKIKENTVREVYLSTACKPNNYDDLIKGIEEAFESKVAYKSGISLLESGNYADAITQLAKVLPEDVDYQDAVEKQTAAVENYKNQVIKEAGDSVAENDYMKAVDILKTGAAALPDDADLVAEIQTCEKNYIAWLVSDAESVFTDYTKYEDALKIIRSGLQNFPDDQRLVGKREYYQSFEPVNLYDLEKILGETESREHDTGTYKDEYSKCFTPYYSADITYDLKGGYNTFTATIYGRSGSTFASYCSVAIYGDGKKLYENTEISNNGRPFEISADVTGVSDFRIIMNLRRSNWGIGMSNMILQKTVK